MKDDRDITEYFSKLDEWESGEGGSIPLELLGARGLVIPPAASLDDDTLPGRLSELIRAMADIGMFLTSTDHLSDRELYERLQSDVLRRETFLCPDNPAFGDHFDFVGSGSEEDNEIYLTYYASEEDREWWQKDFPKDVLPETRKAPFDRDRLLPTQEQRLTLAGPKH